MPSSPQPNTSDSQISGRNPTSALIKVALRMNFASPGAEQHSVERENDSGDR